METKITKFVDLRVWQKSRDLVLEIYSITKNFPKEELYGLTSWLRRSLSYVGANVVEGFHSSTAKELIEFLSNSRGLASEATYFLGFSNDPDYIDNKEIFIVERKV